VNDAYFLPSSSYRLIFRSDPDLEGSGDNGPLPFIDKKYWRSKGKILGRCVEMWDTFNGILDQGVSRNPDDDKDFMHTDL
jgi:hypothetical protein